MCKITAIDVGMCLPKCFVIIVNLFTFVSIGPKITIVFTDETFSLFEDSRFANIWCIYIRYGVR